jgi:hypothetical protein
MSSALAHLIRPVADKLELSTLPFHIHHILGAFLLYEGLFLLVSPALSNTVLFPKTYKRLDRRSRINWDCHVVSMVQSLVINAMAIHVLLYDAERQKAVPSLADPHANWRERLWGYSAGAGRVQSFATGYFLWDLAASIEYFDILGASSVIHAVAALGITCLGYVGFAILSACKAALMLVVLTRGPIRDRLAITMASITPCMSCPPRFSTSTGSWTNWARLDLESSWSMASC